MPNNPDWQIGPGLAGLVGLSTKYVLLVSSDVDPEISPDPRFGPLGPPRKFFAGPGNRRFHLRLVNRYVGRVLSMIHWTATDGILQGSRDGAGMAR